MQQLLKKIRREFPIPIVFVTHDVHEAHELADRIIVYANGSVVQAGTPIEVFTKPATTEVDILVNARSRMPMTASYSGEIETLGNVRQEGALT